MKTLLVGVGAAGNKAVMTAIEKNVVDVEDTIIINSTTKDFPKEYTGKTIVLSNSDTGCGKERGVAKAYAKTAISDGKFNMEQDIQKYTTVIICTSVEGGTGSGSAPIIAKLFNQVFAKNVHIIAFTGFEEDVRGLSNTVEFFKEIDPKIIVQTISNKEFMRKSGNNKLRAEQLANIEMAERISVLTGKDFIDGSQNIDDTDILKLSNTAGYMTVEKSYFSKPLETNDDYEKIVKHMIYDSASIQSKNPAPSRLGIILNISPASEDAIDYSFTSIKEAYGNPYEFFQQIQWDGNKEYIAYIASGMKMPIDEIEAVYNRYKEQSGRINKSTDEFFSRVEGFDALEEDSKFDMINNHRNNGISFDDFLSNN